MCSPWPSPEPQKYGAWAACWRTHVRHGGGPVSAQRACINSIRNGRTEEAFRDVCTTGSTPVHVRFTPGSSPVHLRFLRFTYNSDPVFSPVHVRPMKPCKILEWENETFLQQILDTWTASGPAGTPHFGSFCSYALRELLKVTSPVVVMHTSRILLSG